MLETDILNIILNDVLHNDINSIKKISLINRDWRKYLSNLSKTDVISDKLRILSLIRVSLKRNALRCLRESASKGYIDVVDILIQKRIKDINQAMMIAAQNGHIEIVKLIIKKGKVRSFDWAGTMKKAAKGGHMDIVQLMIEKGANNFNGGMESAAEGGHMDIIELMIEKGALRSDDILNHGIKYAIRGGQIKIIENLIEKMPPDPYDLCWIMSRAAQSGHMGIVELMIEKGANNFSDCMHHAASAGHINIVKLMIEKVALRDVDWNWVIIDAQYGRHKDIVQLLEKHRDNTNNV